MTCRYRHKLTFATRAEARAGAAAIREEVIARAGVYTTLYPFRCPGGEHWHLTSARQGMKDCPSCGQRHPAWRAKRCLWVIYAHDQCPTQAVSA